MSIIEMPEFKCNENTTPAYSGQLEDRDGNPVPLSSIQTLTITVFHEYSKAIINGRDHQDALNAHGVTVSSTGFITWNMEIGDTIVTNDFLDEDANIAEFAWTFVNLVGVQTGRHRVRLLIANFEKVPA